MGLQASTRWLHLLPEFDVSGRSRMVLELARKARMDGKHDEVLLYGRPWNDDADFSPGPVPMHFQPLRELGDKGGATRLSDLAVSRGVQALVAHDTQSLLWGERALGGRASDRLACVFHEPPPPMGWLERRRLRRALRGARARFAVSSALAQAWSEVGAEVEVFAPPVDLSRFHPDVEPSKWRPHLLGEDNDVLIGCVQRADSGKGQRALVAGVEQLRQRGVDAALLLMGNGPEFEALRELLPERPWLFVRKRALEIGSFYTQLDLLALVGENERAPVALFEGLACGRRGFVATRSAGAAEELNGLMGEAGVALGDLGPEAIAGGIERALALSAEPAAARERVLGHELGKQLGLLERALATGPQPA